MGLLLQVTHTGPAQLGQFNKVRYFDMNTTVAERCNQLSVVLCKWGFAGGVQVQCALQLSTKCHPVR